MRGISEAIQQVINRAEAFMGSTEQMSGGGAEEQLTAEGQAHQNLRISFSQSLGRSSDGKTGAGSPGR